MRKSIPFEIFEPNQTIYFDVPRLVEFEEIMGKAITGIMKREAGIKFCLAGLRVGLKHHYHKGTPQMFADKIQNHLENGGSIDDIAVPIIRAIVASGIFGKEATEEAEKKLDEAAGNG